MVAVVLIEFLLACWVLLLKMLKVRTKEVLYERYRTEKLLARRAT